MFSNLDVFKIYSAMARHSAESQSVSATNISRADEPGYKAGEVESFQDYMSRVSAGQVSEFGTAESFRRSLIETGAKPNGNTVDIEQEAFKSANAAANHEMAMTVYSKSLDLLRAAIGRKM